MTEGAAATLAALVGELAGERPPRYAALAAQKNSNSLYLNCVYASAERADRFRAAWAASGKKLDMGKSCIRFKRAADLALDVVRQEIAATTPAEFIALYETVKPRVSSG